MTVFVDPKDSAGGTWVQRSVRAWTTNDADDIASLFTEDAVSEYDGQQIRGREAIVADWLATRDEPGGGAFVLNAGRDGAEWTGS